MAFTEQGLPIVSEQEAEQAIKYMKIYHKLKVHSNPKYIKENKETLLDVLLVSIKDPHLNHHLKKISETTQPIGDYIQTYCLILYHALYTAGQRYKPPTELPHLSNFQDLPDANLDDLILEIAGSRNSEVGRIIKKVPEKDKTKRKVQKSMVQLYHSLILAGKDH